MRRIRNNMSCQKTHEIEIETDFMTSGPDKEETGGLKADEQ